MAWRPALVPFGNFRTGSQDRTVLGSQARSCRSFRPTAAAHLGAADQPAIELFGRGGEVMAQPLGKAAEKG